MLERSVLKSVTEYINALKANGVEVERAVVFGSQTNGHAHEWSDIDLLVVSPMFDNMVDRNGINLLWRVAARVDSSIEPIPCGSRQWEQDDASAIIEVARRDGEILEAA